MDRLLALLIKLFIFLSGFAKPLSRIGIGTYEEWAPGKKLKLLMVGYNGARNTGADARVVAAVRQIKELFGAEEGGTNRSSLEEELFRDARRLGEKIRRVTGLTADEDLKRLIVLLYRNIGIHMTIDGRIAGANEKQITGETEGRTEDEITGEFAPKHAGELTVSACYFSRCYSPAECRLMSCVDAGIVTGICGGGCLRFSQRITEGCGFCRAHLTEDGEILQKGKCNE